VDLREIGRLEVSVRINLAQDRVERLAVVNTVMKFRVLLLYEVLPPAVLCSVDGSVVGSLSSVRLEDVLKVISVVQTVSLINPRSSREDVAGNRHRKTLFELWDRGVITNTDNVGGPCPEFEAGTS
jgi:hypothetical protein